MKTGPSEHSQTVFRQALVALRDGQVPFVVGGAVAVGYYTGAWRDTKDIDVFCEPSAHGQVLECLSAAGFRTRVQEPHWLGKAFSGGCMVDVIWAGGNWVRPVDAGWLERAETGEVIGVQARIAAAEDIILSKAYVADRERYDGADIAHLIRARGRRFDWPALVRRFGEHWELLLQYLVLYRFVYPVERDVVPAELVRELAARVGTDAEAADGLDFRGPLVDRYAYLHDLENEGRTDPREVLARRAGMDLGEVARRRRLDVEAFEAGKVYKVEPDEG